ncbi:hypothetical protein PhCBS80983_g00166 [Powellomyces hirtus]|uniref:NADP-dependent oxidoreductase domain-containing protein n=1 Tax=Powellomyces hirtus TaxID=109895 RepID=A0A507EHK9_9FUNG|nr:hypothetical protein PhCBS80983_g00166 [Powellomyces hirtus]
MPVIGLGTYRSKGDNCRNVVKEAIRCGYRLIDTAAVYKNEEAVGAAVAELIALGEVAREDLFITTKISPRDQGYEKAYSAALESLHLDCLLLHWPGSSGRRVDDPRNMANRHESWRALERLYAEKKVRAIGVSNFNQYHLENLLGEAGATIVPHVNQFEFHPAIYPIQASLTFYLEAKEIQPQAYSSFGEGALLNGSTIIKGVLEIAEARKATVAQVLLKWAMQHGFLVIPKTTSSQRLAENLASGDIELSPEDMIILNSSFTLESAQRFCWDSTFIV